MQSKYSLKKEKDFDFLIKNGKRLRANNLLVFYKEDKTTQIGISIPKKLGGAVLRNKNKRQIKNIIKNFDLLNLNKKLLLIATNNWPNLDFKEKESIIKEIIIKLNGTER